MKPSKMILNVILLVSLTTIVAFAQTPLESIGPQRDAQTQIPLESVELLPAPAEPLYFDPSLSELHRIKDITTPAGDRTDLVVGKGLVVGLSTTGGRSEQTRVAARNWFLLDGVSVVTPETRSMSAVYVSGNIPAYARRGEKIQVTVSVADDATSLRGGQLIETFLTGHDGQVYAVAAGPIIGGGISAGGQAANVQRDHPTSATCDATIEREICDDRMLQQDQIRLILRNKDYSTAVSIANVVNLAFPRSARALDSGTIEIRVPHGYRHKLPDFISIVGHLQVTVDQKATVVVNQKTGTIVMGQNVRLSNVVFAYESLIITTTETPVASQPAPFSRGETVVLPRTSVDIIETGGRYNSLGGTTVGELGRALNALGVSPNSMITILTSLRRQGSLQAELIIE